MTAKKQRCNEQLVVLRHIIS